MPKIIVRFKAGQIEGSWNILKDENLAIVCIKLENIKKIEPFFEVPGTLYTEPDVASESHPCSGSIGVWLWTKEDEMASIQEIFYYDKNINKTHYNGLPHWNHERRLIDINGKVIKERNVEWHIIPDSEELTIYFDGKTRTVKRD